MVISYVTNYQRVSHASMIIVEILKQEFPVVPGGLKQHLGILFGWVHEMIHPTIFWGTWFLRNSVVEPCSKESSQEI